MEELLVSVIIPTYKRPWKMLKRAIDSVLSQTYKNIEIIVVDDSPDSYNERDYIKKNLMRKEYEAIKYIQHSINKGACVARNTGINNSMGELISFLDDDDEWLENKLEVQIHFMKNGNIDLISCGFINVIEDTNGMISTKVYINNIENKTFINLLKENFIGSTSFVLLKRKCIEECGGFNEELKSCQDWELWLRIIQKFNVEYVKVPLVKYYSHRQERITTNFEKSIQGYEFIIKKYKDIFKNNDDIMKINLYRICEIQANSGEFRKSIDTWKKATRLKPIGVLTSMRMLMIIIKNNYKNLIIH